LEKAQREQTKKNEKFRAQFNKEINSELRKNRSDANSAVLQCFDDEELVQLYCCLVHICGTCGLTNCLCAVWSV
jgi:hypothetical protein